MGLMINKMHIKFMSYHHKYQLICMHHFTIFIFCVLTCCCMADPPPKPPPYFMADPKTPPPKPPTYALYGLTTGFSTCA